MPKRGIYKGIGKLIFEAVQKSNLSREELAKSLHIGETTLYGYYTNPPTDINILIKLSRELKINLLSFYQKQEPIKSWIEGFEQEIIRLKEENQSLRRDKQNMQYTIDLQKTCLETKKGPNS